MDQPPLGSPDAPAGPSLLRHTLASTARATAATWLLILLPAYAEWRIATGQAPPGAVDGRTVELAIAAPLAVVFVQLVVNLCVMTSIYPRARDELTRLAGVALAIAAGRRAEVPRRLYSVGAREVAEALRKWQEAASVREALLASAPVGICLLDRMGVIRTANPALRAMLGYERDELEGHAMLEFVHLDDLHLALDLTPAAMAAAGVDRAMVEARHRRSRGSRVIRAGVLAPVGSQPARPAGFSVILEGV